MSLNCLTCAVRVPPSITKLTVFSCALFFGMICAHAAPPQFASALNADSPLIYYRLGEVQGNALNSGTLGSAFDSVYHGSPQRGQSTAAGDLGVRFLGEPDFLESLSVAPASMTGNPSFSAETLVRIPTGAVSLLWAPFLHWGAPGTGNSVYFGLRANENNRLYSGFYNAGLMTSGRVCTNTWLHIVWVRDSGGGLNDSETGTTLYVNGVPVTEIRDPALNPGFDNTLTVTSTTFRTNRATDFTRYATILMDELALYDHALSAAEVSTHWNAFADNTQDSDGDGIVDARDNCLLVANTNQRDSNGDGYGNRCDTDINNDNVTNAIDLGLFRTVFFSGNADADFNGDGIVNAVDLGILRTFFFAVPGPSGTRFLCG